ncbi:MAG: hypothetical protein EHM57_01935 [Actinobacteria bacterium]|nr:MAG: hypothetical protein EHM57_01935 [Actinomycetota bacterium]
MALPRRAWSLLPMVSGAALVAALVNPLMMGLGELRSGAAATLLASQRDEVGSGRWTADTLASNALLIANGVPALSGQQWVGPDDDNWWILDPDGEAEDQWNRGAAYIVVTPVPGLPQPFITASRVDVIEIQVDPCDASLDSLDVARMVSIHPVVSDCLVEVGQFPLSGDLYHLYRRDLEAETSSTDDLGA